MSLQNILTKKISKNWQDNITKILFQNLFDRIVVELLNSLWSFRWPGKTDGKTVHFDTRIEFDTEMRFTHAYVKFELSYF